MGGVHWKKVLLKSLKILKEAKLVATNGGSVCIRLKHKIIFISF
jgi:hypothetical protein